MKEIRVPQKTKNPTMSETEARKILEVEYVDGKPQYDKLIEVWSFLIQEKNIFIHFTDTHTKHIKHLFFPHIII